jgi:hypothetical protein
MLFFILRLNEVVFMAMAEYPICVTQYIASFFFIHRKIFVLENAMCPSENKFLLSKKLGVPMCAMGHSANGGGTGKSFMGICFPDTFALCPSPSS